MPPRKEFYKPINQTPNKLDTIMKQEIKIGQNHPVVQKWFDLPESTRNYLTKKYYPGRCLLAPSEMLTILEHEPQEETPKELFTGGEWEPEDKHVNESPASEWFTRVISDEHGQRVALIYGDTEMQAEANSTLIAQAKNMYYALKGMVEYWEKEIGCKTNILNQLPVNEFYRQSKEALKKANPSL